MNYETINFQVENSIARITINRPDNANTINLQLAKELSEIAAECDNNPEIRAVIFTGAGKMFSAGGDLASFASLSDKIGAGLKELTLYLHGAFSRFSRMRAPLIVAVNGVAAGAGLSIVVLGDYNISVKSAKFTMSYTGAGLSPDGGATYLLPRLIGLRRAKEMMMLNRVLTAEEALDWGLVNEVVEADKLLERAEELARQIASGPTQAYGSVKSLLLSSADNSLETQMELESRAISALSGGEDGQEGITAFLEKRKPVFKGKN